MINLNIVNINNKYNYSILMQNLISLIRIYPFLNLQVIGKSVLGKNLYVVRLGKGSNKVFYSASFHANEWINSVVLMKFIEDYCSSYINNTSLYGYNIKDLFNYSSIYIMPMVNPDGVDLVTGFLPATSPIYLKTLKIANGFSNIPFPDRLES